MNIADIFEIPSIKKAFELLNNSHHDITTDRGMTRRIAEEYDFYVAVNRECEKAGLARHFNVAMPEDLGKKHSDTGDALSNHPKPNKGHKK